MDNSNNKPTITEINEHNNTSMVTQEDNSIKKEKNTDSKSPKQKETKDNDLAVFIGNNYEKITTKPFNFAGFFFTSFYMFYRKMIIPGIIFTILTTLVTSIIPIFMKSNNYYMNTIIIYVSVVIISIISGFIVNKLYIKYANKQIAKIKNENSQKTPEQIYNILLTKGGTSFGFLIIGIITALVISQITSYISSAFGYNTNSINIIHDKDDGGTPITDTDPSKIITSGKYQGILFYNATINLKDKIDLTIPEVFENLEQDLKYEYSYSYNTCHFQLASPGGFETIDQLFDSIASYYETTVNTKDINDNKWSWIETNNDTEKKFYYGTSKDNTLYIVEYELTQEEATTCEPLLDEILNSIKIK